MIRASQRHRSLVGMSAHGAVAVAVALSAVGCKSGGTWAAKPSWWAFGGGDEAAKLASAPPAPGDVTKPSATAKPYPTTTTPEGYVMANAKADGQPAPTATAQPAEPAVVTYGSTPPAPAASVAGATSAPAAAGGLSSITPQVGPYASVPPAEAGAPATAASYASTTSAFAPGNPPASAGGLQGGSAFGGAATPPVDQRLDPAGTRVADARASESWSSPATAASADSRYGTATGSRFSGGAAPAASVPAVTSGSLPAELPATPPAQPGTIAPPTPTRRPDPGYRPGGTSSYRPSRTILAAGSADDGGIRPASFDADADTAP